MDAHMADADPTMEAGDEEQIELIAGDDVAREFELGDAPVDDDEDAMEDDDDDGKISAEDADVRDDAEMVFQKHAGPVYSISVNPVDSRLVLTGGGDDVGVIWNREDGSVLHTLSGHTDSVVSVDFSFDGKYAATGGYDGVVKIWEVATGRLVQTLEGPSQEVEWITWHKKGNILLAGSGDGTVWMWLATTGECMHVFAGHEDSVTCGSFTGSGKMIVTGSTDGTVRVWNPKSGECIHVFRGHDFHEGPITFLTCHPSQPLMISGSQDGTAKLLQIQTKRVLATFAHDRNEATAGTVYEEQKENSTENSVECAGFSNSMQWAATGCLGGSVRIWDLSNYHCRHICRHPAGVIKLIWHPTVPIVYSCTVEGLIYVWDARSGQLIKTLAGHTDMVLDMAFVSTTPTTAPTGLLTASDDETIRLFAVTEQ